jgi:LysR family pca operon transcriptional activator
MMNGHIKFRHLECFLAVAQHSSLQKAALALSITQSAVSKTIKELEDLLETQLFDRGRRGTQMTQQGEIFFNYAEAAVKALQQATESMGPVRNAANTVIRIGATPAMTVSFLPPALRAFNQRISNIQVSILTGTTDYLMAQVREGHFDLLLCRHLDPEHMGGLSFEYLFADPLVVVVRPGHPLLESPIAESDEPCQFLCVLPPKTSINRHGVAALAMALNIRPVTNFIESRSLSFARAYTVNSDAVWFVPWCAVKLDLESGALIRLLPATKIRDESFGLMARSTGLMMRSNFVPSPEIQILIGAMRESALQYRTEVF